MSRGTVLSGRRPVRAKFHYTDPTRTRPDPHGLFCGETPLGPCGSPTKSVRVRVVEFSSNRSFRVAQRKLKVDGRSVGATTARRVGETRAGVVGGPSTSASVVRATTSVGVRRTSGTLRRTTRATGDAESPRRRRRRRRLR